jgi:methylenetetrahydrofolate dehydrogenase (NAD+)
MMAREYFQLISRTLRSVLVYRRKICVPFSEFRLKEYTKRPRTDGDSNSRKYHPRHVVHPCSISLQEILGLADVVVSAVPSAEYKVKTSWLKDGAICLNVAADKNFEKDVREKAG